MPIGPLLLSEKDLRCLIEAGEPVMVEFFAPDCRYCPSLEPIIERLAQLWGDRLTIGQVNIAEEPKAARRWTVMSTPTVIFFVGGAEVARLTGVQSQRQYERELRTITEHGSPVPEMAA